MKIYTMPQRSEEWFAARRGKFTASEFCDLMLSSRQGMGEFNKTQMSIIYRVASERITGNAVDPGFISGPMQWGIDHEDEARSAFEMETGKAVHQVGFIERDEWIGCSPDGLIDEDEGLELKCPNQNTHLRYLYEDDAFLNDYKWQCIGSLWISGRKTWNLVSFDPRFPSSKQLTRLQINATHADFDALENRLSAAITKAKEVINGTR